MILHVVCLALSRGHDPAELARVMRGLSSLVGRVDGLVDFAHGRNIDAEGKSPGFPYGFLARFTDRAALDRYAADPDHQALGARLLALCGGADGIVVYDLDIAEAAPCV